MKITDSRVENTGQSVVQDDDQGHTPPPKLPKKVAAKVRVGFFSRDFHALVQDDETVVVDDPSSYYEENSQVQSKETDNLVH